MIEKLREDDDKEFRKAIGCSTILISDILYQLTEENNLTNLKVYYSSNNDCSEGINQVLENLMNKKMDKIKLAQDFSELQVKCLLLSGDLETLNNKNRILIDPIESSAINRNELLYDFPNKLFLTIEQFKLGEMNMKSKNYALTVYICNENGELFGEISRGNNISTSNPFHSSYYYHVNNPFYNETISITLPDNLEYNIYCIIRVEHISTKSSKDILQSVSVFPITINSSYSSSKYIICNDKHEVSCYKSLEINKDEQINKYLERCIKATNPELEIKNKCKDKIIISSTLISPNHSSVDTIQWFMNIKLDDLLNESFFEPYTKNILSLVSKDMDEILLGYKTIFNKLFSIIKSESQISNISIQAFLQLLYHIKQTEQKNENTLSLSLISSLLSHFYDELPYVGNKILVYILLQYYQINEGNIDNIQIVNEITDVIIDIVQFIYDGYEKLGRTVDEDIKENINSIIIYYVNFVQSINSKVYSLKLITTLNINIITIFDLIEMNLENDNILITLINNLLTILHNTPINNVDLELKLSILFLIYDIVDSSVFSDSPQELRLQILELIVNIFNYYKDDNNKTTQLLSIVVMLSVLEFCQVKCPSSNRYILLPFIDNLLTLYDNRNVIESVNNNISGINILSLQLKLLPIIKTFHFMGFFSTAFLYYFYLVDDKRNVEYINENYKDDNSKLQFYDKIVNIADTILKSCYKNHWKTIISFKLHVLEHIPVIYGKELFGEDSNIINYCKSINNEQFLPSFTHLSLTTLLKGYENDSSSRYIFLLPEYILKAWNNIELPRVKRIDDIFTLLVSIIPIKPNLKIFDMVKEIFYSIVIEMKEYENEFIKKLFYTIVDYLKSKANYTKQEMTYEKEIYTLYNNSYHLQYFFIALQFYLTNNNGDYYNNDNIIIKFLSEIHNIISNLCVILHPYVKSSVECEFMCSIALYNYMKILLIFNMEDEVLKCIDELCKCQDIWKSNVEKCSLYLFGYLNITKNDSKRNILLDKCLSLCEETKTYEIGINAINYVEPLYLQNYKYDKLSEILLKKSDYYSKIYNGDRSLSPLFPNYFYIGLFGDEWSVIYKNKEFIAKANNFEKLDTFSQRFKKLFSSAELDLSQKPLTEEQINDNKSKRIIKTFILSVVNVDEINKKGVVPIRDKTMPKSVRQYKKSNESKYFCSSYAVNKHIPKSNNEFLDKWIIKTYYETKEEFPFAIRFSEIKTIKTFELNPILGAIDALNSKINEISDSICDANKVEVVSQNYTQLLGGVIDAAVNGGLINYYPIINGEYKKTHPEIYESIDNENDIINELINSLHKLIDILNEAMTIQDLKCDKQMRPFHEHLMSKFEQMKKVLGEVLNQENK